MESLKSGFNTIRNYDYKSKYNQTVGAAAEKADGYFQKVNSIWQKIFISSNIKQFGNIEFDIRKEEEVRFAAEITDYVLEDNTAVQNAISLKPLEITLSGVFGENVIKAPKKVILSSIASSKLNALSGIAPKLTATAQQYLTKFNNVVNKIDDVMTKIGDTISFIKNLMKSLPSNQEKQFYAIWVMFLNREPLTIKTNFCTLQNMAIKDIRFKGVEETTGRVEVVISFKQLNFAFTQIITKSEELRKQQLEKSDKGQTTGTEVDESAVKKYSQNLAASLTK